MTDPAMREALWLLALLFSFVLGALLGVELGRGTKLSDLWEEGDENEVRENQDS